MPENINLPIDILPFPVLVVSMIGRIMTSNCKANEIINKSETLKEIFPDLNLLEIESEHVHNTNINNNYYELIIKKINERYLIFIHDVTEFRESEKKIIENKAFLRKVIDTDPNLIFIKNSKGEFILANEKVANIYGTTTDNIVGKTDAYFNEDSNEVNWFNQDDMFVINHKQELEIKEEKVTTKDGKTVWLETKKLPIFYKNGECHVLGISADITHRKELQEQLLHTQKLEAIGQLAGGIAHDFNNLLTGILGYTSILHLDDNLNAESKHAINSIRLASERAANLTQQLLAFARKGKNQNIPINLHDLLNESIDLISRTFEKNIIIDKELLANNPFILGDPTQIQQVIINLALNARDAMSRNTSGSNGGNLKITTKNNENSIIFKVKDTGCGISDDNLNRIFEPFFTTKGDSGCGMGLATVYGIVENHNGNIDVNSTINLGTEFTIKFNSIENYIQLPEIERIRVERKHEATILLVDDHAMIRDVTSQMLDKLGYKSILAKDGVEAIEIYRENYENIDLVLLDMVMPKLNVREIFNELRMINPNVRVILSTGYVNNLSVQAILNEGMAGFVQKPYHIESLSKIMSQVLTS